jgi:20S proteasome alpha/beta subunit
MSEHQFGGLAYMKTRLSALLLCFLSSISTPSAGQEVLPTSVFGPLELKSVSVHGTIDVVIATRQGYVLATDSRATLSGGTYRDDAQKLFTIGERAACVIAGLTGADFGAEGFHLTDAIGSHIAELDRWAHGHPVGASDIAKAVASGLDSVSGLLLPAPARPMLVGEVSIVSIGPSGKPEWVSLAMPFNSTYVDGQAIFQSSTPMYYVHATSLGLRFDIQALGQPQVVNALIDADSANARICRTQPGQPGWCVDPKFTHSAVMREFYLRKRLGTLDGFSLKSAIELSRTLIQATLETAQSSWGVGGPIDVLTVTKTGARWIVHKSEQSLPPPFHKTVVNVRLMNGEEPLDGLQCLLCTFENMKLYYSGNGRVELVRPRFEGTCELTLGSKAGEQRPDDVRYLKRLVSGHCETKQSESACPAPICFN